MNFVSIGFVEDCEGLTRNYIARIHGILVLDESKAVHELDLLDRTSAMSGEMSLYISLGSYVEVSMVRASRVFDAREVRDWGCDAAG